MIITDKELISYVTRNKYDAIVVEGYDGVGKGRVLNIISKILGVIPYRPDYNLWQQYDHRQIDRWKVSGFFWDVFSHFNMTTEKPMLFDRGVISGAVYNKDYTIADNYPKLLKDMKVLHILVTCSEEDYYMFARVRGSVEKLSYEECSTYTREYIKCLSRADVEYVIYLNQYNESEVDVLKYTCAGCGHYSYGICRHPIINKEVDPNNSRCSLSEDKEVQDQYDPEMQPV